MAFAALTFLAIAYGLAMVTDRTPQRSTGAGRLLCLALAAHAQPGTGS